MGINPNLIHMLSDIDVGAATYVYNSFWLDPTIPIDSQLDLLDQDLMQIQYGEYLTIDLGWVDDTKGRFALVVIENRNWDEPLIAIETRNLDALRDAMVFCIDFVKRKLSNG